MTPLAEADTLFLDPVFCPRRRTTFVRPCFVLNVHIDSRAAQSTLKRSEVFLLYGPDQRITRMALVTARWLTGWPVERLR